MSQPFDMTGGKIRQSTLSCYSDHLRKSEPSYMKFYWKHRENIYFHMISGEATLNSDTNLTRGLASLNDRVRLSLPQVLSGFDSNISFPWGRQNTAYSQNSTCQNRNHSKCIRYVTVTSTRSLSSTR